MNDKFNKNKGNTYYEDKYSKHNSLIDAIKRNGKLSKTLTIEEINLPQHYSYCIAKEYSEERDQSKKLNTNQLRKYFQQISNVVDLSDFNEKRNQLFKILPNIAYAAGRNVCPKEFYKLMETCITKEALVDDDDIQAFVDFLTAVVAYYKYLSGGQK